MSGVQKLSIHKKKKLDCLRVRNSVFLNGEEIGLSEVLKLIIAKTAKKLDCLEVQKLSIHKKKKLDCLRVQKLSIPKRRRNRII